MKQAGILLLFMLTLTNFLISEEHYNYYSRNLDGSYILENISYKSPDGKNTYFKYVKEEVGDKKIEITGYYYGTDKVKFIDIIENNNIVSTRYFDADNTTKYEVENKYNNNKLVYRKIAKKLAAKDKDYYLWIFNFTYLENGLINVQFNNTREIYPFGKSVPKKQHLEIYAEAQLYQFDKPKEVKGHNIFHNTITNENIEITEGGFLVTYQYGPNDHLLLKQLIDLSTNRIFHEDEYEYKNDRLAQKISRVFVEEKVEYITKYFDGYEEHYRNGEITNTRFFRRIKIRNDLLFEYTSFSANTLNAREGYKLISQDEYVYFENIEGRIRAMRTRFSFPEEPMELYTYHGNSASGESVDIPDEVKEMRELDVALCIKDPVGTRYLSAIGSPRGGNIALSNFVSATTNKVNESIARNEAINSYTTKTAQLIANGVGYGGGEIGKDGIVLGTSATMDCTALISYLTQTKRTSTALFDDSSNSSFGKASVAMPSDVFIYKVSNATGENHAVMWLGNNSIAESAFDIGVRFSTRSQVENYYNRKGYIFTQQPYNLTRKK